MSELTIKVEVELGPRAQEAIEDILEMLTAAILSREEDNDDHDEG